MAGKQRYEPELSKNPELERKLEQMWRLIERNPGIPRLKFLHLLGCEKDAGEALLLGLERWGYLLSEYNDRLFPFRQIGREAYNGLMCNQLGLYHRRKEDEPPIPVVKIPQKEDMSGETKEERKRRMRTEYTRRYRESHPEKAKELNRKHWAAWKERKRGKRENY